MKVKIIHSPYSDQMVVIAGLGNLQIAIDYCTIYRCSGRLLFCKSACKLGGRRTARS